MSEPQSPDEKPKPLFGILRWLRPAKPQIPANGTPRIRIDSDFLPPPPRTSSEPAVIQPPKGVGTQLRKALKPGVTIHRTAETAPAPLSLRKPHSRVGGAPLQASKSMIAALRPVQPGEPPVVSPDPKSPNPKSRKPGGPKTLLPSTRHRNRDFPII